MKTINQQNRTVQFRDLGLMDYRQCWDLQENIFAQTVNQKTKNRDLPENLQTPTENHLLFVEHPHVFTLGKSGDIQHLLADETELKNNQASFYKINRGGDITYHGPGQLVVYPILDLDNFFTDIHKYLRYLEEIIISILKDYGIEAGRSEGETGVWIDSGIKGKERKICAMGVRCSRWVTMHGLALNVNADLNYFSHIIPCGIEGKAVTSMEKELGRKVDMNEVKEKMLAGFSRLFECKIV